jgi:ribosomal protein L17
MDETKVTSVKEDIDVGLGSQTLDMKVKLTMSKDADDASYDYKVDVDEMGQIVFTPTDTTASFTDICATTSDVEEHIIDNKKVFSIDLTANILFEDDNQTDPSWEASIDDVGQAVIYPIVERASFLTVSVKDSLNLITEEKEEEEVPTEEAKPSEEESKEEVKIDPEKEKEEMIQNTVDNVTAEVKESIETSKKSYKKKKSAKVVEPIVEAIVEEQPYLFEEALNKVASLTKNFATTKGMIKTGFFTEGLYAKHILKKFYNTVQTSYNEGWTTIIYDHKNVNTLTEDLDPASPEFVTKREICENVIDDLEESLNEAIEKLDAIERLFKEIGIHYADIEGYFTNYLRNFIESDREISCEDFRNRLEEFATGESEE